MSTSRILLLVDVGLAALLCLAITASPTLHAQAPEEPASSPTQETIDDLGLLLPPLPEPDPSTAGQEPDSHGTSSIELPSEQKAAIEEANAAEAARTTAQAAIANYAEGQEHRAEIIEAQRVSGYQVVP